EEVVTRMFLPRNKSSSISSSNSEEMKSYASGLMWAFLDYSNLWRAGLSWSIFFLLNVGVPLVSHLVFSCSGCDPNHQRPYDAIVQIFLSSFASVSFISLSSFGHRYGLRKFLFLDKLSHESETVRDGYSQQIQRSLKLLSAFVLPCSLAEAAYKIWWFSSVGDGGIPYFYSRLLTKLVVCLLLISSWVYRIAIGYLVCILFRLTCHLQLLRLNEFTDLFQKQSDVTAILAEHLRIRRNLRVISHRFRLFILSTLVLVSVSQFVFLLVTTEPKSQVSISTAGELALCSVTLVTGLFICLRSAAKITHKALSVASFAAKWHACATINTFDEEDDDGDETTTTTAAITSARLRFSAPSDEDEDNMFVPASVSWNSESYQKRQALVKYLEHNRAGITVYGFMLDRSWLHTIFVIQLSFTLWILNKTIGIS
ncbi:hypothetical protein M569_02947, partial [Genlisea aurea]